MRGDESQHENAPLVVGRQVGFALAKGGRVPFLSADSFLAAQGSCAGVGLEISARALHVQQALLGDLLLGARAARQVLVQGGASCSSARSCVGGVSGLRG